MADSMSAEPSGLGPIPTWGSFPTVSAERAVRIARARVVLVRVLAVMGVVLAITGVYLFLAYRPRPSQSWPGLAVEHRPTGLPEVARSMHRYVALVTIPLAAVLAVIVVVEAALRWRGPARRRSGVVTGPAIIVLVLVAGATGLLLPWDQVALWTVTVGGNFGGYREILWGDEVRFVIMGGSEVSTHDVRVLLVLHAVVLTLALAGLLWLTARNRPTTEQDAPT